MVHVNLNTPDATLKPGIDLWVLRVCEEKHSRGGDQMLSIRFDRVSDVRDSVFDIVMLEGPGWGLGKQKLAAMLGAGFDGDLNPLDLIGKRFWLATKVEAYNGRDSLKVDIKELANAGYQPESDVPAGHSAPEAAVDVEAPF